MRNPLGVADAPPTDPNAGTSRIPRGGILFVAMNRLRWLTLLALSCALVGVVGAQEPEEPEARPQEQAPQLVPT